MPKAKTQKHIPVLSESDKKKLESFTVQVEDV